MAEGVGERGSGLLSTVIGVACIAAMLGVCANVALGLWARSVTDSVAHDAARNVATAAPDADRRATAAAAMERARDVLGPRGQRVQLTFEHLEDDRLVTLRVQAPGVSLLPRMISGGPTVGGIDRRIVVRRERP